MRPSWMTPPGRFTEEVHRGCERATTYPRLSAEGPRSCIPHGEGFLSVVLKLPPPVCCVGECDALNPDMPDTTWSFTIQMMNLQCIFLLTIARRYL